MNCCVVAKYHTPVGGILMDRVLGIRVATVVFAALILSGQVLYCTVLYCTVLYCAVLYCTVLISCGQVTVALGGFTRSSGLMQVCNYGDYFFIVVTISCFNAVWEAAVRYRRRVTHRGAECLRGVLVQESFFIDPTVSLGP